jgi:hypothetical protein
MTDVVKDVYPNIIEPTVEQALHHVFTAIDIGKYFENRIYISSLHTTASSSTDKDGNPNLHQQKATVSVGYSLNPLNTEWNTTHFGHLLSDGNSHIRLEDTKPVLHDETIRTTLVEQDVPCTIKADCVLKTPDREVAHDIMSKFYSHYPNGEMIVPMDFVYNAPIPKSVLLQLYGLYKMSTDEPEEFFSWLDTFSNGRIRNQVNRLDLDGRKQPVVNKMLKESMVKIEMGGASPNTSGSGVSVDSYDVEFTLTLQISRCDTMHVIYPITVSNQFVQKELLHTPSRNEFPRMDEVHPYFKVDLFKKMQEEKTKYAGLEPVVAPWYDIWRPSKGSALGAMKYQTFFQCAFTIENPDDELAVTTIDLANDLPAPLVPEIIDIINDQGANSLFYTHPINISVYGNDTAMDAAELELNGTILTVKCRARLLTYRLVLSEYVGPIRDGISKFWVGQYDIIVNRSNICP